MLRWLLILSFAFLAPLSLIAEENSKSEKWIKVFTAGIFPAPGADKRTVTIADDEFVLSVDAAKQEPDGSVWWGSVTDRRLKLEPERAKKLWAEIERLRIFDWHDSYSPEDVGTTVDDGMGWSVSIEIAGRYMKSSGMNTYPLLEPFGMPTVDVTKPTAFHKLQELLRPLEEEANQSPQTTPLPRRV